MLKITICDETWRVIVLESLEELPGCGDNPRGATYPGDKEIYFRKAFIDKGLVRHELFHAHYYYLFICNTASRDDREETMALWLENRGDLFNAQVDHVYDRVRKMK